MGGGEEICNKPQKAESVPSQTVCVCAVYMCQIETETWNIIITALSTCRDGSVDEVLCLPCEVLHYQMSKCTKMIVSCLLQGLPSVARKCT